VSETDQLGQWIVVTLRRRGELEAGLRMRIDPLPEAVLPWRPLEGARTMILDRLVRFRCEFAVRPGQDPERAKEILGRLKPKVDRILKEEDILGGGQYAWGLAEAQQQFGESADGRFLTCVFEISLNAEP
jgi:hypothetical protein